MELYRGEWSDKEYLAESEIIYEEKNNLKKIYRKKDERDRKDRDKDPWATHLASLHTIFWHKLIVFSP